MRPLLFVTLCLLAGLMPVLLEAKPAAADVPQGFVDRDVTVVEKPTALAFTPDGRLLITSKPGQLRVYKSGDTGTTEALDLSDKICSNSERGLLGVAVDPDFGTTGHNYVYLYYTFKRDGVCPDQQPARDDNPVNRVSRFVMTGDILDPKSEEVLIDNIPSPNGNHNAGDVHFGKDGKLYISVGDGACDYREPTKCQSNNDASRDRNILLGKILRVNPNGSIPADNPYAQTGDLCGGPGSNGRTAPGNNCKETFAVGLRNPFRMAFDPDAEGTKFFINDVGGNAWEEVDRGKARADYGWNVCEGKHDNPYRGGSANCSTKFTPPLHNYSHSTGCTSITGGAFVPDSADWPGSYGRSYLFGDYVCGKIFKLTPKRRGGYNKTILANRLGQGGPVHMTFGPSGSGEALYYTTFANGGGQVRRISYIAGNRAPNALARITNDNYGPQDKAFQLSAQDSTDPDGDALTYEWDFGDGTTGTGTDVTHTYDTAGKKTATLTVSDGNGGTDTAEVDVFPGDTAQPEPVIQSPSPTDTFEVGQQITTLGSATDDDEPGNPPSLQWEILRHHNGNHTHPLEEGIGSGLSFTAPAPEDLLATDPQGNYLEIRLTATDSQGLSKTVSQRLEPRTVDVRFETKPIGLKLRVNGKEFRAPRTFLSWEGYKLNVNAPSQRHDGKLWEFRSWSDGRAAKHTIVTPGAQATYVATFRRR